MPRIDDERVALEDHVDVRPLIETATLSVVRWRCRRDPDLARVERRHSEWTVTFCQFGACRLHADGFEAVAEPGVAVIHAPGVSYAASHPHGCNDGGLSVAIRRDVGDAIAERLGYRPSGGHPLLTVAARPATRSLRRLVELIALAQRDEPIAMEERALALFRLLLAAPLAPPSTRRGATGEEHCRLVERVRDHLGTHLDENLTLPSVARSVGASPAHLTRLFRRRTGVTIGRYLRHVRIATALGMLDRADGRRATLAEIACATGFASHSHLTTTFARELGLPPVELRRGPRQSSSRSCSAA